MPVPDQGITEEGYFVLSKVRLQDLVFMTLFMGSAALSAEMQRNYEGVELPLAGLGLYEYLGEEIYLGALFGAPDSNSYSSATVRKLQMRIVAENLSARRFNRLWLDAIALNSEREERNRLATAIMEFGGMLEMDLRRGDRIDFDYLSAHDLIIFQLNDVVYGEISGADFFQLLLQGWIGPTPPSVQFKEGLTGQQLSPGYMNMLERFTTLSPTQTRREEVRETIEYMDFRQREVLAREQRLEQERLAQQLLELTAWQQDTQRRQQAVLRSMGETDSMIKEIQSRYLTNQLQLSQEYEQLVSSLISQQMQYPAQASNRQIQGRVLLEVSINRPGYIVGVTLIESSGHSILDETALEIVNGMASLPPIPEKMPAQIFTVNIPFNFVLD